MTLETCSGKVIKKPPTQRNWYCCPVCGTKLLIYDNSAHAEGIFLKCKNCKNEIPILIKAL